MISKSPRGAAACRAPARTAMTERATAEVIVP
ncbi:hypothetical protein FHS43_000381 [Streptosporangium becharense]|uniref:Uncharacterized protein n=1 Tax=Streptosporangium becharense TaxID=1816182 RepID=A0A7W9IGF3_9ACTN|nr:hypothetical protein [Streptosporangium becharense]MBB5819846.1 hypothetical protein [Streptosporangium becharense]